MHILLLSNLYPPYVQGGAEIAADDIATGLRKLGHQITVVTSWYGLPEAQHERATWRTLHYSPATYFDRHLPLRAQFKRLSNYYMYFHCTQNAQELKRIVSCTKPDLLYIWEITGIGVSSILNMLLTISIPIIFQLGSYWYQYLRLAQTQHSRLRMQWLKRLLIGYAPKFTYTSLIAVSEAVKREYVQSGCAATDIEVIYNGIDPRFLYVEREDKNNASTGVTVRKELQLLFAGRLCTEKGVLVALKALDILINEQGRRKLHLHVCGEGDKAFVQSLQAFLATKHLTQAVTFHDKVVQEELIDYYDRADMMLVPSLWQEPFGLVVVEAMARSLPVIASDVGGPAEILASGQYGLLIQPGDEKALARAIIMLWDHPEERQRLVQAAYAIVQERFTLEKNVKLIEQHLLRSLYRHGCQGPGIPI